MTIKQAFYLTVCWCARLYKIPRKELVYKWVSPDTVEVSEMLYALMNFTQLELIAKRFYEKLQSMGLAVKNIDGTHFQLSPHKFTKSHIVTEITGDDLF